MRVAIIDPFLDTSHAYWANGIIQHSRHDITLYYNKPKHWKWQMIGGTLELAEKIRSDIESFDLLLVTDMLDLACFLGYLSHKRSPRVIIYFHENQITYPWSPKDPDPSKNRDHHYGFMNLRSAYLADHIVFNSRYHKKSFYGALPKFKNQFPSINWPIDEDKLLKQTSILPIGLERRIPDIKNQDETPVFVWNHRWEYDKGPDQFFQILFQLKERGIHFKIVVLGKPYPQQPAIFKRAKKELKDEILHWGYVERKEEYYLKLSLANIALVTGHQDFFGISVIEAIQMGCFPLLPNRLAYPEHLPNAENDFALYEEHELIHKLIKIIERKYYLSTEHYSDYITKYQWDNIIGSYDLLFEGIASQKESNILG